MKFNITELQMNFEEIHYVEHIHWVDWPDLSVPDDTFVWMKLVPSLRKRTPTIVHCSAGGYRATDC